LIAIIIRNARAVLSRAISLGCLERREHLEKWDRGIKEVEIGEVNKDVDFESRLFMLVLKLFKLHSQTRFNR